VELTAEHGIAASGGFIESNPGGKPLVTQVLAQDGRVVGVYRKNHVVDEEAEWFTPGNEAPVFPLRTPDGELVCALAICADSDRPDLFAAFARQGARVVLHSSAPGLYTRCSTPADWQAGFEWYTGYVGARLPVWAREQRLFIAVATQTGATVDEDFPGGSFVFGPDGTCLARAPDYREMLLVGTLRLAGASE
jgi:predicted amidohydrolase